MPEEGMSMLQAMVISIIGMQQELATIPWIRFRIPSTSSQRTMLMPTEHTLTCRDGGQLDSINERSQIQRLMTVKMVSLQPMRRNKRQMVSSLMTCVLQHSFAIMTSLYCLWTSTHWAMGKQQKYMVVLLAYLFNLLPPQTTVLCLYDVGCVLDQSTQLVILLCHSQKITDDFIIIWLVWHLALQNHITSAIHHICNACIWTPMELSTCLQPTSEVWTWTYRWQRMERLWARLHKLIPITRGCSVSMYQVIVIILNKIYPLVTEMTLVHWQTSSHTECWDEGWT